MVSRCVVNKGEDRYSLIAMTTRSGRAKKLTIGTLIFRHYFSLQHVEIRGDRDERDALNRAASTNGRSHRHVANSETNPHVQSVTFRGLAAAVLKRSEGARSVSVSTRTYESASSSTSEACTERSAKNPGTSSSVVEDIVVSGSRFRTRTRM